MPLNNLGAILTFARDMELGDSEFFKAAGMPEAAGESGKNAATLERLRRENVTEMILEPIKDFSREPYVLQSADPASLDRVGLLERARALDARAVAFYEAAAGKLSALPEAARGLQRISKKRKERLSQYK